MITENMTLQTAKDADTWAGAFELPDEQARRLSDWIWNNKPQIGCTRDEHPLFTISLEAFWDICEGTV